MTTIHNKRFERYDVYIGRPTIYGNPFEIGRHGTRESVIKKYKEYFGIRLNQDEQFRIAIFQLKNKRLGCFCKPQACHGDIICEYLNMMQR